MNKTEIRESAASSKGGRPKVSFEDASDRTKRRRCSELLSSHSVQEVASTAAGALHKAGKRQVALFVANVTSTQCMPKQPEKRQCSEDRALSSIIILNRREIYDVPI